MCVYLEGGSECKTRLIVGWLQFKGKNPALCTSFKKMEFEENSKWEEWNCCLWRSCFFLDPDVKNAIPTSWQGRNLPWAWCSYADSSLPLPGVLWLTAQWSLDDVLSGPESSVGLCTIWVQCLLAKTGRLHGKLPAQWFPVLLRKDESFWWWKHTEKTKTHVSPPLPFSAKQHNVFPYSRFPKGPTTHLPDTEILNQKARLASQPLDCRWAN